MQKPPYYTMLQLIEMIDEPNRSAAERLYKEQRILFMSARGSTHNHQAWDGGYHDHIQDAMNYAILFYRADASTGRLMPFSLSDALLCIFLHDLEKPWRFEKAVDGSWQSTGAMDTKKEREAFRVAKMAEYGFRLTSAQQNGVKYAEGDGADYRSDMRVSNELAGFVHVCDHYSARVRHAFPKIGDQWAGTDCSNKTGQHH